jgi:hypothetical protein
MKADWAFISLYAMVCRKFKIARVRKIFNKKKGVRYAYGG